MFFLQLFYYQCILSSPLRRKLSIMFTPFFNEAMSDLVGPWTAIWLFTAIYISWEGLPQYGNKNSSQRRYSHDNDVIMSSMASQITSLTIVYSTVYSGADQRKHQSSASLPFVWGIHRWPVNSPHKWPVTREMFPFDDVIIWNKLSPICLSLPLFSYITIRS